MNYAAFDLAIAFPPSMGMNGACSTIADLCRYFRAGIGYPSKALAVRSVMQAEFWRQMAHGHGNRAARRQAQLEADFEAREDALACSFYDANELTEADVDDMEHRCEARPHFSHHTNPHD
jgi:hypothetical protein